MTANQISFIGRLFFIDFTRLFCSEWRWSSSSSDSQTLGFAFSSIQIAADELQKDWPVEILLNTYLQAQHDTAFASPQQVQKMCKCSQQKHVNDIAPGFVDL